MTTADASWPLQVAIVAALKGASAVTDLVAQKIYDVPSADATKPYLSMGPVDVLTEEASEYEGSDTTLQVDGWATGPESMTIKKIGRAVRATLHEATLTLSENHRLVSLTVEQIRYLREPDGITQHAVITVRARTEPSA